jgi:hypothetical protein
MINVKYPRRGFVVEEVFEACKTEGCTAKKFVVNSWEHYGEDNFNNLTYGQSTGEHSTSDHTEGICPECGKPVVYKDYFVITSDANAIKIAFEAYYYARDVLNAPFPEGESLIATDAEYSYKYAKDILKAPFLLGEAAIATDAKYSCHYAKDILKAPFLLGEKIIATNKYLYKEYKELFPEPQATPEPQAPTIEEPQAPDSINIVSGFYLKEKTSMSDKQKRKQKRKDVIKSTFLTLVYTLEDIIDYDQEGGTYHFLGSLFQADNILKSIHDLMETFPNLTRDLAEETYPKVKSYMDEYLKKREEKQEKEKPNV